MKVLIVDMNGGRSPDIGYQIKNSFENLGHETTTFDYRKWKLQHFSLTNKLLNKALILQTKIQKPKLLVVNKGESILPGTIDKIKEEGTRTVAWNPDEPFGTLDSFNKIKNVDEYDAYFSYDKQYVKPLKEINPKTYYLPPGAEPYGVHKGQIPFSKRKFPADVCLIGTAYKNRIRLMKPYANYSLRLAGPWWEKAPKELSSQALPKVKLTEMARLFNESKIVLNPYGSSKHFICPNPRTFEIPASKSFQLTDMPRETKKFFKPNKEIVIYQDEKEMKELIDYYIENDDERNKISKAGYKRVIKEHTMNHRIKEILKRVKKL